MKKNLVIIAAIFLLSSCVAKRYLTQSQKETATLRGDSTQLANSNQTLEANISSLKDQIATLQKNIDDLKGKVSGLNNQNSQLGQQTAEQQSKLTQSQQRLQQLETLLNQQKEASVQLKNRMAEALKGFNSNELSVYQKDGKVYVSLSEQLLFPSGSAVVNPKGVDALSKLAAVLNLNSDVAVNIEGHTDNVGSNELNQKLSDSRANSVKQYLMQNGVDESRIVATGYGEEKPVADNKTAAGRSKNRRVEMKLRNY